jgi:hypothetical protein
MLKELAFVAMTFFAFGGACGWAACYLLGPNAKEKKENY